MPLCAHPAAAASAFWMLRLQFRVVICNREQTGEMEIKCLQQNICLELFRANGVKQEQIVCKEGTRLLQSNTANL